MHKKIAEDVAGMYLGDVPSEKCFWVNNGPTLKNLEELLEILKTLNDDAFKHHVNEEKNDFAKWIDEVIGDKKLAENLAKSKNRKATIKKLDFRINQLKRALS